MDIDELCRFIPYFENIDPDKACKWVSNGEDGEGCTTVYYPIYEEEFEKFISAVYNSDVMYKGCYQDELGRRIPNWQKVDINEVIKTADFELLQIIFTKAVRVERFAWGAWATMIERGTFLCILQRLKELHE